MQAVSKVNAVMNSIEAAIHATYNALDAQNKSAWWLTSNPLNYVGWTHSMEDALGKGKPDELQSLGERVVEDTLRYVSAELKYARDTRSLSACKAQLLEGLNQAIQLVDEPDESVSSIDKQRLQGMILCAIDIHGRTNGEELKTDDVFWERNHRYNVLVTAFKALSNELKSHSSKADKPGNQDWYPAVKLKTARLMQIVPFEDCIGTVLPGNAKLGKLFDALQHDEVQARHMLGRDRFSVEDCHSWFMIDTLLGRKQTGLNEVEKKLQAQQLVRSAHAIQRAEGLDQIERLRLARAEFATGLLEAVIETEQWLEQCPSSDHLTADQNYALHVAMNNCLAADALLREVCHKFKDRKYEDVTLGKGDEALRARYEKAVAHFRQGKGNDSQE